MTVNVIAYKSRRQHISEKISLVGNMAANEYVKIQSEIDGIVESIGFEEGQNVKKGRVLFRVDEKKLKASLAQAQANLKLSQASTARYKALIESRVVSRQEYEQAIATLEVHDATVKLTEAQLNDATIVAPFDGVMGARSVSEGQFVTKGTSLTSIINQNPMKAEFNVPERYLSRVNLGQEIEITVAAYPEKIFTGKVFFVDPQIDELTRSALVKARVPNPDGTLRRGMFANLNLIVDIQNNAIIIPETAMMLKGDEVSVFTVDNEEKVHLKKIEVGLRFDGMIQILSGLREAEVVVTEGHQKLHEGVKVTMKFQEETEKR
ncbi:MAG: MexH family multidrug efflux RND transporter periplasmic adaptor subunit [Candidatus Scalindua sp.]|nr:MAG: MexH family multidrug efflux RND transporter periplasmic adaptor subunit [Candidatus Scalindua sp.]